MQLNLNSTQTMLIDFTVKKMATLKILIFKIWNKNITFWNEDAI